MSELAQSIAHHRVAPARQVFKVFVRFPAHGRRFERQHDAQFGQQAADAVDQGGALLYVALARAVHEQARLLLYGFERNKAHVGTRDRFSDAAASAASFLPRLPLMR